MSVVIFSIIIIIKKRERDIFFIIASGGRETIFSTCIGSAFVRKRRTLILIRWIFIVINITMSKDKGISLPQSRQDGGIKVFDSLQLLKISEFK